jgi:hypothetical protein
MTTTLLPKGTEILFQRSSQGKVEFGKIAAYNTKQHMYEVAMPPYIITCTWLRYDQIIASYQP